MTGPPHRFRIHGARPGSGTTRTSGPSTSPWTSRCAMRPSSATGTRSTRCAPRWRSRTRGTPAAPTRSTTTATRSIPTGTSRVVPSHNGVTTANFNADTFRIWGETEHPEEAFEVLTYLIGDASQDLLGIYGGMPARTADQDQFFANLDERWTQGVNWQVARDGVAVRGQPELRGLGAELPGDVRVDRDLGRHDAHRWQPRHRRGHRRLRGGAAGDLRREPSRTDSPGPPAIRGGRARPHCQRSDRMAIVELESPTPDAGEPPRFTLARREAIWG